MSSKDVLKRELLLRAVHEHTYESDQQTWGSIFTKDEVLAYKIETGTRFFTETGERILLPSEERDKIASTLLELFNDTVKLKKYIGDFQMPSVAALPTQAFDGRSCCQWATQRAACDAVSFCQCTTRWGGWWCNTPERHGSPHRGCPNPTQCTCRCGHAAHNH